MRHKRKLICSELCTVQGDVGATRVPCIGGLRVHVEPPRVTHHRFRPPSCKRSTLPQTTVESKAGSVMNFSKVRNTLALPV